MIDRDAGDVSILTELRLTAVERCLNLYGVVVHQQGYEDVVFHWRSNDKVNLYSATKTFTSLGVGMCVDQCLIGLDDVALSFFPEFASKASAGSESITIRNLLMMASGKRVFGYPPDAQRSDAPDWVEQFFAMPIDVRPGTEFFYSNHCSYVLSRIVERVTGQTLRQFLIPRLFEPLGIHNPQWDHCPHSHTLGHSSLRLTIADYAKIGTLFLNRGRIDGRDIVSEDYLQRSVTDTIPTVGWASDDMESNSGYGYHLWRCSPAGAYRSDGKYGQFSVVFPAVRAVVTVTAHQERNQNDILRAIYAGVLPHLVRRARNQK